MLPIYYKCEDYLNDLSTLVPADDIQNYELTVASSTEDLNPNNAQTTWIVDLSPHFCPTVCEFVTTSGGPISILNSTLGSRTLTIDRSAVGSVTGYVQCSYQNSTPAEIVKQSNTFTVLHLKKSMIN